MADEHRHQHDRQHPRDGLTAYALDALEASERAPIEAHLASCPECPDLVDQYRSVLSLLPYALAPQAPPPGAKAALLTRARGQPAPTPLRPARPRPRLAAFIRPLRWAAVAALLGGLLLWNVQLQQQLGGLQRAPGIEQLAGRPDGPLIPLVGTGDPNASARLYVTRDGQRGQLAITGLAPLPPGRIYQLWFARPGQPTITGGAFRVNDNGAALATVIIPAPLDQVRAIAVTEEPSPGSPAPTGEHLLDGAP